MSDDFLKIKTLSLQKIVQTRISDYKIQHQIYSKNTEFDFKVLAKSKTSPKQKHIKKKFRTSFLFYSNFEAKILPVRK